MKLSCGTYEQSVWHYRTESKKAREAFFLDFVEKVMPYVRKTKAVVTGGVHPVGAIVDILEAGWTASALDGQLALSQYCQTASSKRPQQLRQALFDEQDFSLGDMLSGAQMRQIGRKEEPSSP
ncbi:hypothetical protein CTA2_10273 [Colletotrichum tanaceti]|uniref:Uncharacterized protein n=1 Tax=Colletotrichum tanaceti TaxID=1306861 RepID=A0A4U6XQL9_9PEZI|nr:hypothetical protein CTA2_10273 [Colletotrichum tanaceti]TKW58081.1 hypothetical protein CTA1_11118 [Colletotrichum tanaceti]